MFKFPSCWGLVTSLLCTRPNQKTKAQPSSAIPPPPHTPLLAAFGLLVFAFLACQKRENASLSAAYRQLPDSIFNGTMPPADFFNIVRGLPTGTDMDSAYQRILESDPVGQSMDLACQHFDFYEKISQISEETRAWLDIQRGIVFSIRNRPDSSRLFFERAGERALAIGDTASIGESLMGLAGEDMKQNRPVSAANRLAEAIAMYRLTADSVGLSNAAYELSLSHIIQKDWKKAEIAAREGLVYITPNTADFNGSRIESNLTVALFEQKKLDEAAVLIEKNLALTATDALLFYRPAWLNLAARLRLIQKKPLEALDFLREAERLPAEIAGKAGEKSLRELLFAEVFSATGQQKEAIARAENSLKIAEKGRNLPNRARAERVLARLFEADGQLAAALQSHKNYRELADSIYQANEKGYFQDLLEQEKTAAHKREVATLAASAENARQRAGFWGILGLLTTLGVAFFSHMRRKNERLKLEKALALQAAATENAARELELHKTQLEEFTTLMMEKNTRIEALQSKLAQTELPGESSSARSSTLNSDDVDALFQTSLLTEDDWQRFQRHFEKVFPGVLGKLKIQYPELSTAELRLVLLTKMGLKTKEISSLLGISLDSVRKLQYRFKKKMGCSEQELLEKMMG